MTDGDQHMRLGLLQRLPLAQDRAWLRYGFAFVSSGAALALRWGLDSVLPPGFPYLTFFPAVIVTAFFFGLGPGMFAAVVCGLASWYWFIPPEGFGLAYASAVALGFYVLIVTVDIALVHWMQRANAQLAVERNRASTLAATREMLFKELQHRVGNNLQMVASLIGLQKRALVEPAAVEALSDAACRVAVVGRIQRSLYSPDGEPLELGAFLQALLRDTIDAAGRSDVAVDFANRAGSVLLEPAYAIPAALVVTEAVSNALEHGFADRSGTIAVTLANEGGGHVVTVIDDGRGLPDGFALEQSDSLGLRIARNLAASLGGGFTLESAGPGQGTVATIRLARKDRG